MQVLSAVSMVLFIGICSLVGLRLMVRAWRTGNREQLLCAVGFTWIGLLGYPATIASRVGMVPVGEVNLPLFVVGTAFTNAGIAAFFLFTCRVFRSGVGWARNVVISAWIALAACSVGQPWVLATAPPEQPSFAVSFGWGVALQLVCFACFGWIALEGTLQWSMGRRRLALGLADAEGVDRLRLWAIFGGSTLLLLVGFAVPLFQGISPSESPVAHLSSAVFGLVSSGAAYLAFLPPAWYRVRRYGVEI